MSCSKVLVESSSPGAPQATQATSSHNGIVDDVNHNEEHVIKGVSSAAKGLSRRSLTISDDLTEGLYPITAPVRVSEQLQTSDLQDLNTNGQNLEMEIEDTLQPQPDVQRFPNSREDSGSSIGSPSSKGDDESNLIVHCEIHWEDLQLREQIGQGKLIGYCFCKKLKMFSALMTTSWPCLASGQYLMMKFELKIAQNVPSLDVLDEGKSGTYQKDPHCYEVQLIQFWIIDI